MCRFSKGFPVGNWTSNRYDVRAIPGISANAESPSELDCCSEGAQHLFDQREAQRGAVEGVGHEAVLGGIVARVPRFAGQHIAPARDRPKTRLKTVASMLDSTATLSPVAMPALCRAHATR